MNANAQHAEPTPRDEATRLGSAEPRPTGQSPSAATAPLRPRWVVLLALLAVAAFHLGFLYAPLSWLVLVWLGCLFALRRTACGRWAFYTGLAIGLGIYGPQLSFFWNIFGPAAIALWLVLAFWLALFLLLLHGVDRYWGTRWAVALAPVLWLGLEFFRSELYYLRFSWFTAGSVPPVSLTKDLLPVTGVYGSGALLMLGAAAVVRFIESPPARSAILRSRAARLLALGVILLWIGSLFVTVAKSKVAGLPVAGIQLEFPKQAEVLHALEKARSAEPADPPARSQLYLLSEYTFDGPVPDDIRAWCRDTQCWLVAGGKEPLEGGKFYNTAFVVSTNGEVVFKQAKAVPIQFFNDGVPAAKQRVWDSPWGKIGLCICYDLSYTRIVDRLIRQGALALIVPAMDTEPWGLHQHRLNARMTPIRAAEYRVPIFRVASSGISQLVDRHGRTLAALPFPGQGEVLHGQLSWTQTNEPRLPLDRYLAPVAVLICVAILPVLALCQRRARRRPPLASAS